MKLRPTVDWTHRDTALAKPDFVADEFSVEGIHHCLPETLIPDRRLAVIDLNEGKRRVHFVTLGHKIQVRQLLQTRHIEDVNVVPLGEMDFSRFERQSA